MYTEKDGKLLKWGGKRGGAAGRSSFWPAEIDRSHHLNQDSISPGTCQSSSQFGHVYAM